MPSPKDENISDAKKENKQSDQPQEVADNNSKPDDDAVDPGAPFPEHVVKE